MSTGREDIGDYAARLAKQLRLRRPIAFVDLETTGTNRQTDRIVEIAVLKVFPDGETDLRSQRVNPEVSIPAEAARVHGIRDEDVRELPTFRRIAKSLAAFLEDADLAGFGVARFDLPLLEAEFRRAGQNFSVRERSVVDALSIYFLREPRDLSAAVRFYLGREMSDAHSADADVVASLEVLTAQLERYEDLPRDLPELDLISAPTRREPDWIDPDGLLVSREGVPYLNFGRHKGLSVREAARVDPAYIRWMLSRPFPDEAKRVIMKDLPGDGHGSPPADA